jgi:hypothetical protein
MAPGFSLPIFKNHWSEMKQGLMAADAEGLSFIQCISQFCQDTLIVSNSLAIAS